MNNNILTKIVIACLFCCATFVMAEKQKPVKLELDQQQEQVVDKEVYYQNLKLKDAEAPVSVEVPSGAKAINPNRSVNTPEASIKILSNYPIVNREKSGFIRVDERLEEKMAIENSVRASKQALIDAKETAKARFNSNYINQEKIDYYIANPPSDEDQESNNDSRDCAEGLTEFTLTVGGSGWESEMGWSIGDYSGGAGSFAICLADGDNTLTGTDSWGDGWDLGSWTLTDADGTVIATGTVSGSTTDFTFCIGADCAAPVPGCTDTDALNFDSAATVDDGSCSYSCAILAYSTWSGLDGVDCDVLADATLADDGTNCTYGSFVCDGDSALGNGSWGPDCANGADEGEDCCANGGDYSGTDCASLYGCDGVWNSGLVDDCSGNCGGTDTIDDCDVCAGDGSSCSCTDFTLTVGGGSWDSEITWDLGSNTGAAGTFTVCLADGFHTFNGFDSFGDGWNGATWSLTDAAGNEIFGGAVSGSSTSWEFCLGADCPVYGCMDANSSNYNADAASDDGSCEIYAGADWGYWDPSFGGFIVGCSLGTAWHDHDGDGSLSEVGDGTCFADLSCAAFNCDGGDCEDCLGDCYWNLNDGAGDHGTECWDGSQECDETDCPDVPGCPDGTAAYSVSCDGGSFQGEVSWSLTLNGEAAFSGGAPYGPEVVCLADGASGVLTACDSWGDGWNGNVWTIIDVDGAGFSSNGPATGTDCEDFSFSLGVIYGCTDPNAPNYNADATDDDGSCEFYVGQSCDGLCGDGDGDGVDDCAGMILDCNLAYCWTEGDLASLVGDGTCDALGSWGENFNCAYFNYDGCDCLTNYGDPDGACYTACEGEVFTLTMNDSFGDGWNGGQLCFGDQCTGLASGSAGSAELCLADGIYAVEFVGGSWFSEVSWSLADAAGNEVLAGGAPYSGPLGVNTDIVSGCTDDLASNYDPAANYEDGTCEYATGADITVFILTDDYSSETSWDIIDSDGAVFASGDPDVDFTEFVWVIAVPEGNYTFNIYDSWGDGICCSFGDGMYAVTAGAQSIVVSLFESGEFESTDFSVDADGNALVYGCTDPAAPNYNEFATTDDGTECDYTIYGCTLEGSPNYDPTAEADNGSCEPYPGADGGYWDWAGYFIGCGSWFVFPDCEDDAGFAIDCAEGEADGIPDSVGDGVCDDFGSSQGLNCIEFAFDGCDCGNQTDDPDAPCYEAPVFGCTDMLADNYDTAATADDGSCAYCGGIAYLVSCDGGSWQSEVSWTLTDANNFIVLAGGAPYAGCFDLSAGDYTLSMNDAFGDGWNGNVWSIAGTDISGTLDNINDDGTYGTYSFSVEGFGPTCDPGDVNGDGSIDILDIVSVVNYILEDGDDFAVSCADIVADGAINVLDIVAMVNIILDGRTADATEAGLIKAGNALNLNADGYIGGVQMTLSHGADFSIELTDKAMVADYRTNGNETTLIIVAPESDELFIADGEYDIVEMIVANSAGPVDVSVVPTSFILSQAYPNPFNPSTTINLSIPEAGHTSVMVYNVMGQLVSTLADGHMNASDYSFTWDASSVPSGVYLITATTANQTSTQKVMLLK